MKRILQPKSFFLVPLALVVLGISAAGSASEPGALAALPEVATAGMEEAVRGRLEEAQVVLAKVLEDPGAGSDEQGRAFGALGRLALAFNLNDLARVALENSLILDSQRFDGHYFLGVMHQRKRHFPAASQSFKQCLSLRPGDVPTTLRLAEVARLAGHIDRARSLFESLDAAEGKAPAAALYGLGRIAASEGDFASAVGFLSRSLESQPEAKDARQQLGLAYREMGELEKAREQLSYAAQSKIRFEDPMIEGLAPLRSQGHVFSGMLAAQEGRLAEAEEHYRAVVEAEPENPDYRRALGSVLHRSGKLDLAAEQYARATRLDPRDAVARLRWSDVLLELGEDKEQALEQLEQSVNLAPDLLEARVGLGKLLLRRGALDSAEEHLRAALELAPEEVAHRLSLGRTLIDLGRSPEAVRVLEEGLGVNPEDAGILLALGRAYAKSGSSEKALAVLQRASAVAEGGRLGALAEHRKAMIFEARGELAEAEAHYRKALARAADLSESARRLATLLLGEGRPEPALVVLTRCLKATEDPAERARLALQAGVLEQQSGDLAAAIELYAQALAANPNLADGHFNLGLVLAASGRLGEAVGSFSRAVELRPKDLEGYLTLQRALVSLKDWSAAIAVLRQGCSRLPRAPDLAHRLARLLATAPIAELRDGEAAVAWVEAALDLGASFDMAETRGMALAAAGLKQEAIDWQNLLIEQAGRGGAPAQTLGRLRRNLELYRLGEPVPYTPVRPFGDRP